MELMTGVPKSWPIISGEKSQRHLQVLVGGVHGLHDKPYPNHLNLQENQISQEGVAYLVFKFEGELLDVRGNPGVKYGSSGVYRDDPGVLSESEIEALRSHGVDEDVWTESIDYGFKSYHPVFNEELAKAIAKFPGKIITLTNPKFEGNTAHYLSQWKGDELYLEFEGQGNNGL